MPLQYPRTIDLPLLGFMLIQRFTELNATASNMSLARMAASPSLVAQLQKFKLELSRAAITESAVLRNVSSCCGTLIAETARAGLASSWYPD